MSPMAQLPPLTHDTGSFADTQHHIKSPFYPWLPSVVDASSLHQAVMQNPQSVFNHINNLANERENMRAEVKNLINDINNVRLDYKSAREKYEELFAIEGAKQVVLCRSSTLLHRSTYT